MFLLLLLLPLLSHQLDYSDAQYGLVQFQLKPVIRSLLAKSKSFGVEVSSNNVNIFTNATRTPYGRYTGRAIVPLGNASEYVMIRLLNSKFNQKYAAISFGPSNQTVQVDTEQYVLSLQSTVQMYKYGNLNGKGRNSCFCVHRNCACCASISIPEFHHALCGNITYNAEAVGLDFSVGVDGHYFTQEISLRNPPPICFSLPIPGAEHIAGICAALSDLDLDKVKKTLSGCIDLEVELVHLKIVQVKLGCFTMPI